MIQTNIDEKAAGDSINSGRRTDVNTLDPFAAACMREAIAALVVENGAPFSEEIVTKLLLFASNGYLVYPVTDGSYIVGDGTGSLQHVADFAHLQSLEWKFGVLK